MDSRPLALQLDSLEFERLMLALRDAQNRLALAQFAVENIDRLHSKEEVQGLVVVLHDVYSGLHGTMKDMEGKRRRPETAAQGPTSQA